ncbi:Protein smg-like protein [Neisseria meningitidis]|nr:Protein smg-like protein [Neisseria meningitidis]
MTEVIAYLIEHFQDFDTCPPPEDLGMLLEEAGFDTMEIGNTLMMMEVLLNTPNFPPNPPTAAHCACTAKKKPTTCRRK